VDYVKSKHWELACFCFYIWKGRSAKKGVRHLSRCVPQLTERLEEALASDHENTSVPRSSEK